MRGREESVALDFQGEGFEVQIDTSPHTHDDLVQPRVCLSVLEPPTQGHDGREQGKSCLLKWHNNKYTARK
jgi:hypothetical protein